MKGVISSDGRCRMEGRSVPKAAVKGAKPWHDKASVEKYNPCCDGLFCIFPSCDNPKAVVRHAGRRGAERAVFSENNRQLESNQRPRILVLRVSCDENKIKQWQKRRRFQSPVGEDTAGVSAIAVHEQALWIVSLAGLPMQDGYACQSAQNMVMV